MTYWKRRTLTLVTLAASLITLSGCGGGGGDSLPTTVTDDHPWYVEISATNGNGSPLSAEDQMAAVAALNGRLAANGPAGAYAFAASGTRGIVVGLFEKPSDSVINGLGAPLSVDFRIVSGTTSVDSSTAPTSQVEDTVPDVAAIQSAWSGLACGPNPNQIDAAYGSADDYLVACSRDGQSKYVLGPTVASSAVLESVSVGDYKSPTGVKLGTKISLTFTEAGAQWFSQITQRLASDPNNDGTIAILVDGFVVVAPRISQEINDGQASVTGADDAALVAAAQAIERELGDFQLQVDSVKGVG